MPFTRGKWSGRHGFTLIELLVIILIIAIVGSIVVPAYAQFWARSRFDTAIGQVRDVMDYAREQAVALDTTTTVTFDGRNQVFTVRVAAPPPQADQPVAFQNPASANTNAAPEPRSLRLGEEFAILSFQVGANAAVTAGRLGNLSELHFRGDGTSEGAQFTLISAKGHQSRLVVWPSSGRITVEDT